MINFKLPFTTLLTISLFSSALLAQQSATVSQKTSQEKRTQNETTVSDENSMEIQLLAPFQMIGPAVLGCKLLPQKPA